MPFPLPPVRRQALSELRTPVLRWLASFDPFGSFGGRSSAR